MFSEEYTQVLRDCMTADPQLPRPNPTTSFWQKPPHPTVSNAQSLTLPSKTDFAIIGSGITGCSVTRALLSDPSFSTKRVTVLEARTLCSSATGRNGGHLVSDTPDSFSRHAEYLGVEKAKEIARFSFMSMERIKEVLASLSEDVREATQLREVTSVSAFGDVETFEHFKQSLRAFEEALPELKGRNEVIGKEEAEKRFKFRDVVGAELQHKAGALWPYRFVTGLFEKLMQEHSDRFSIETSTPAQSISYSEEASDAKHPYAITTSRGIIRATTVIHCTNAHASHLLPALSGKIFPLRGTMSVQSPSQYPHLGSSNSWSYVDKGFLDPVSHVWSWTLYYITQDPHTGDFYIGGEKQKLDQLLVSDDTVIGEIPRKALAEVLPKIFSEGWKKGEKPIVKSMWSGIMAFTADGMPLVGRLTEGMTGRREEGEWFAGGYNGHGMDKSWLTGEALVNMIAGRDVSGWFPSSYLISEGRLKGMDMDNVIQMLGSAGS